MKTTKLLVIVIAVITIAFTIMGCDDGVVPVSKTAINTEHIEAHDAMETVYEYEYDYINGKFVLLPFLKNVHYPAVYRVEFEIVYSDGSVYHTWYEVGKEEYDNAVKAIEERGK